MKVEEQFLIADFPKVVMYTKRINSKSALTMVELMISTMIFSFLIAGGYRAMQIFAGKMSQNLSKRLVLQMEARKALLNLYREVQEGIEVIQPAPGSTLPYMIYRDLRNNIIIVYLEEDPILSKDRSTKLYKAMVGIKDPKNTVSEKPKMLMRYVSSLNFTAHHHGGVLISCTLRHARGKFSLINFVRLKNTAAE